MKDTLSQSEIYEWKLLIIEHLLDNYDIHTEESRIKILDYQPYSVSQSEIIARYSTKCCIPLNHARLNCLIRVSINPNEGVNHLSEI